MILKVLVTVLVASHHVTVGGTQCHTKLLAYWPLQLCRIMSDIYLAHLSISVRQKGKDLIDLIQDDDRLREDRKKAKKNKDKYVGMSGDNLSYRYSKYGLPPSCCTTTTHYMYLCCSSQHLVHSFCLHFYCHYFGCLVDPCQSYRKHFKTVPDWSGNFDELWNKWKSVCGCILKFVYIWLLLKHVIPERGGTLSAIR